jgi:hypothetical protein
LKNVTNLIISTNKNQTKIETIEADSFISTAFVETILLQSISTKTLKTHAFRGLSHCSLLDLSNSFIESIEEHTFYRIKNISYLNLSNCGIKKINEAAFKNIHQIKNINLEGNYLSDINKETYLSLILDYTNSTFSETKEKFLNFERNPIKCDCNLKWLLENKSFLGNIKLPGICSGPKGYDCLTMNELSVDNLATCSNTTVFKTLPCDNLEFKMPQNKINDDSYDDSMDDEIYDELNNSTLVQVQNQSTSTTKTTTTTTTAKKFQTYFLTHPKPKTFVNKNKLVSPKNNGSKLNAKFIYVTFFLYSFLILIDVYC